MANSRLALDPNRCAAMVEEELPSFINRLNEYRRSVYERLGYPYMTGDVYIDGGRKYIKLAYGIGSQTSVFCFIRREDGAVLKAAGWKAPALNFVRGSIFDSTVENTFTRHGIKY